MGQLFLDAIARAAQQNAAYVDYRRAQIASSPHLTGDRSTWITIKVGGEKRDRHFINREMCNTTHSLMSVMHRPIPDHKVREIYKRLEPHGA